MSEDTKDILAFGSLMVLWPIGMVALLCMTAIIVIKLEPSMDPYNAIMLASVIAGLMNGAAFIAIMFAGRFAARLYTKFKGEE